KLTKWDHFMKVRSDVLKAQEEARNEKVIGKPLEAKLTIVPKDTETKEVLESIPHLHQMLIVSEAEIAKEADNTKAYNYSDSGIAKHEGETCVRCCTFSQTIEENTAHPTLCARCSEVVGNYYSQLV